MFDPTTYGERYDELAEELMYPAAFTAALDHLGLDMPRAARLFRISRKRLERWLERGRVPRIPASFVAYLTLAATAEDQDQR